MSDRPGPTAPPADPSSRLSEVSRLASLLADRVLAAQIDSQPIPKAHIHALLDAAIVLENHGADLPPLLEQMVQKLEDSEADMAEQIGAERTADALSEGKDAGDGRLAWLFRPFQGTKS